MYFFSPNLIVELGTSLGISTSYLAKGNRESNVFTFEGCPETAAIARENFKNLNLRNVDLILESLKNTLSEKN